MIRIKITTVIKVMFFIMCMAALAVFLPDEDEDGGAWLFTIGLAIISAILILVMFTKELDWMYKKPWRKS